MPQPKTILTTAKGLNNVLPPARLPKGKLSVATNVKLDATGRVSCRNGYTPKQSGEFHSLFRDTGACLVCRGTALFIVNSDADIVGLRSGMSGDRVSCAQVNDRIYYANGTNMGFVLAGQSYPWRTDTYQGPETMREYSAVPVGKHIAFHAGRIFIFVDDTLYWTELHKHGMLNKARNHKRFKSRGLMIKSVSGGLFISDQQGQYFLSGNNPHKFSFQQVASYPATEWSEATHLIPAPDIGLESPGLCAMWMSGRGACVGLPDGSFFNMTEQNVKIPAGCTAQYGASYIKDKHFIGTIGV